MLQVELPHVNVLSKIDLIEEYGKLGKVVVSERYLIAEWFIFYKTTSIKMNVFPS